MSRLEHLRQLHADGGKIVNIEEASIVDFLASHAPVGETVWLSSEEFIVRGESSVLTAGLNLRHYLGDGLGDARLVRTEPGEAGADYALLSSTFGDPLEVGLRAGWKVRQRVDNAFQLRGKILSGLLQL